MKLEILYGECLCVRLTELALCRRSSTVIVIANNHALHGQIVSSSSNLSNTIPNLLWQQQSNKTKSDFVVLFVKRFHIQSRELVIQKHKSIYKSMVWFSYTVLRLSGESQYISAMQTTTDKCAWFCFSWFAKKRFIYRRRRFCIEFSTVKFSLTDSLTISFLPISFCKCVSYAIIIFRKTVPAMSNQKICYTLFFCFTIHNWHDEKLN